MKIFQEHVYQFYKQTKMSDIPNISEMTNERGNLRIMPMSKILFEKM